MELESNKILANKEKFVNLYKELIKRDGSEALLEYLLSSKSDFFTAPASSKYHNAYEGGLCEHSLNVFECLKDYTSRSRAKELYNMDFSEETLAISALLHDICKVNLYKVSSRNVKDESGKWISVPYYEYDDKLPYGHGEKSVYIINGYLRLTRDEAFAIRYHMGYSSKEELKDVSAAFEMFPLSFALATADMEATFFIEGRPGLK